MKELEKIINEIKDYCSSKDDIIMGFLFGSYVYNYQCKESDIDIALYLKKENEDLEIEIQNDLERLLNKQIDMVVLTRAPATLAWNIIRKGMPIIIRDRRLYLDFLLDVSNEAQDFIEFNLDTWRRKYGIGTSR